MKLLLQNGTIRTLQHEHHTVEAVLVEDGIITRTGNGREISEPGAEVIDLEGGTLLPGFVDGHSHISLLRDGHARADLTGTGSFAELQQRLRRFIRDERIEPGIPVFAWGYDHERLRERCHPDRRLLDEVSTVSPVLISHVSGHVKVVNTLALKLAGVDRTVQAPQGGVVGRDPATGEPDGYLEETAMSLVPIPEQQSREFLKSQIESAQQLYAANGITTVQDGGCIAAQLQAMKELEEEGRLYLDVVSYVLAMDPALLGYKGEQSGAPLARRFSSYRDSAAGHWSIGGYKIILDGSPQARTAWMSEPYLNGQQGWRAYPYLSDQQTYEAVRAAVDEGSQILAHCNGDAAAEQFITAYEQALAQSSHADRFGLRPVMIHAQTVREDQLERMAAISMIPSFFIGHVYYWGDVHLKNFGRRRGEAVSPLKAALQRNIIFSLHQDSPVTPPDMLHSIWCAVNRITREGELIGGEYRISVYEALRAASWGGAYSYGQEGRKGTIAPGMLADFVLLDSDPIRVSPPDLRSIRVQATFKGGKKVFTAR